MFICTVYHIVYQPNEIIKRSFCSATVYLLLPVFHILESFPQLMLQVSTVMTAFKPAATSVFVLLGVQADCRCEPPGTTMAKNVNHMNHGKSLK